MIDLLDQPARSVPLAVLDLEMTGLDVANDRVIEVAVVRAHGVEVRGQFQSLVSVPNAIPAKVEKVTGIATAMLDGQPAWPELADAVRAQLDGAVLVAHNVPYDLGFLEREMERACVDFEPPVAVDTLLMARRLFAFRKNTLAFLCETLDIALDGHHRALADAHATLALYHRMLEILDPEGTLTVRELNDLIGALAPNSPLRLRQTKLLRQALEDHRSLRIDYQNTSEPTQGVVHREIGVWHLNLPYIQAWCFLREGERIFRLDRIQEVAPGERTYEIPNFKPRI